jgi:two-component system sensor histidine kinase/response regulator
LRDRAAGKLLEIVVDLGDLPATLVGDENRIGQILLNFLSNAVKFTEHGPVLVLTSVLKREGNTVLARFEVCDNGIGLTREQQALLFRPFTQADVSTTRKFGGTGLGLAVSKRLAELMDGTVGCDSHPGHGSCFWADIPLQVVTDVPAPRLAEVLGANIQVLVADGQLQARDAMVAMLHRMGLQAVGVSHMEEAFAALAHEDSKGTPFRVALFAHGMTGLDHAHVHEQILSLHLAQRPDLLMLSASAMEWMRPELERIGFAACMAKPVMPSVLREALIAIVRPELVSAAAGDARGEGELALIEHRGSSVLVVEDNPVNQEVAYELLTSAGLSVDIADDGVVALERAAARQYDLVLTDLQMPRMGGIEATRNLRRLPGYSHVPILAMTADVFQEQRQACIVAGMDDFVTKPVVPDILFQTVARWLSHARTTRTLAGFSRPPTP